MKKYIDRREQRKVTETMNVLLLPMLYYLNNDTAIIVRRALYLLGEIEIESQGSEDETSYTPTEVRDILITEGQEHGSDYGIKLGDIIKFSPSEVERILKAESEVEK